MLRKEMTEARYHNCRDNPVGHFFKAHYYGILINTLPHIFIMPTYLVTCMRKVGALGITSVHTPSPSINLVFNSPQHLDCL